MLRQGIRLWVSGVLISAVVMMAQDGVKKLSKAEASGAVLSKVNPEYPAIAKQLKLEGSVELEAVISEGGGVEDVRIVSGNPVLTKAAVEAVKKWKFTPVRDGGKPSKAVAPLSLTFKL